MKNTKGTRQRRAIIYTRVSTDEQAEKGYSLADQEVRLRKYCSKENIIVVEHFQDDYSAKTFMDRPSFSKMFSLIKSKILKADLLLTTRYDRFSRNANLTLQMIKKLEKYGIEYLAIEQPVDLSVPENHLLHIINAALPEIDNLRRGLNTMRGMRRAQEEGNWVATAPKGYSNIQRNGKKLIEPNEDAPQIEWAFQELSTGLYPIEHVRKKLWQRNCKISKSQFCKLLRNPVYMGKIRIKEYKDEPEKIVQGIHKPLVDEDLFYRTQQVLDGKQPSVKPYSLSKELFPLRGFLICPKCGKSLTGSFSTSRTKEKHGYYHCQKGCKERFRLNEANDDFVRYLNKYQIKDEILKLYYLTLEDLFKTDKKVQQQEKSRLEKNIEEMMSRIEKSFDLYIDGKLSQSDYQRGKLRYEQEICNLQSQQRDLMFEHEDFMQTVKYSFGLLRNLPEYYAQSAIEVKHQILGSIFPEKLIYENRKYRTTQINRALSLMCNNINGLGEIKKETNVENNNSSLVVTPERLELSTH